jgi:alpha-amylase/alpha-mannosidase (GH57 family)
MSDGRPAERRFTGSVSDGVRRRHQLVVERYICIHGHFYQPPRENPWLEAIELQDSAYPEHDWNERITAECYATNAASRILDEHGLIVQIVNNYAKMSFNFGPTLLAWIAEKAPDVYGAIGEADRASRELFSGHGSALAQAYNHMILPLANRRDKYTQVLWGIGDFKYRFGRSPEGMWLPETAVDLETLDILAELGIRFTILAPRQASRVRPVGNDEWQDISGARIDPTMAYSLQLPSGRTICLFFYDGPISRAVAFEGLLSKGESFAKRLCGGFSEMRTWPQLVHIATDGETYGHHHRYGDMALAYALHYIEANHLARLTNYGEYLERHPPTHEVEIFEYSSWSCIHGIERWRSDCGCNSGGRPEWNQAWRAPLRKALDLLRDVLAPAYQRKARSLLRDPWRARDEYIRVILDRSRESIGSFLENQAVRALNEAEQIRVLRLLELQRHAMLMYTSCGWFFDELSGLETVQILQYAGRVLQLAREVFGDAPEERFLALLEQARSNIAEHGDGRRIYERFVKPTTLDLEKVGAHYAVSSLFKDYGDEAQIFCYTTERQNYQTVEAGRAKLVVGRARVTSGITRQSAPLAFGVLHFGDHNLKAGVREHQDEEMYRNLLEEVTRAFNSGDLTETIRILDQHFQGSTYSLRSLFRDEQRKILDIIQESSLASAEAIYRQIYESNAPFLRFLRALGNPPPAALSTAAEFVLNASLRRAFEDAELNPEFIENLLEEVRLLSVSLNAATLEVTIRRRIEGVAARLSAEPTRVELVVELETALEILRSLPFEVNLRKVQNICYQILQSTFPHMRERAEKGGKKARLWVGRFTSLGEKLSIRMGRR